MKQAKVIWIFIALWPVWSIAGLEEERAAVKQLLGDAHFPAKLTASRDDGEVVVMDLETFKGSIVGQFPGGGKFGKISRVWWAPDGTRLVFSHEGKGYIHHTQSGKTTRFLVDRSQVQSPTWWRDPGTGEDCITFMDRNAKDYYRAGKSSPGSTYLYRLARQTVEEIADFPCDGGLSIDGTHLAEAYGGCLLIDLINEKYHVLNRGKQACNASLSPDGRYHMMHLFLPHTHFGIRNKYDKVLWQIEQPAGSGEWQTPRFSTHPDFCMATAKYGADYKPVLIKISTKEHVVLHHVPGSFRAPHLWMPTDASARPQAQGMSVAGAHKALERARLLEAREARPVYQQLAAEFAEASPGIEAARMLASPAFKQELAAGDTLDEIRARMAKLKPPAEGQRVYNNPSFFNRNQATLVQLVGLMRKMKQDFPNTRALQRAERAVATVQLPAVSSEAANVELEVEAFITAVSRVPTYEQIAPYTAALTWIEYKVDRVIKGTLLDEKFMAVHWGMLDTRLTEAASWRPGTRQRLKLDLFDAHPELAKITRAQEAFEDVLLNEYWVLKVSNLP